MASVTANMDLTVLANITVAALGKRLDELRAFTTAFDYNGVYGDSAKVFVMDQTDDATAFDASTNNYETVGADTTTGIDVQLNQKIKKTGFALKQTFGNDITTKLMGLGNSVGLASCQYIYNLMTPLGFSTSNVIGADLHLPMMMWLI